MKLERKIIRVDGTETLLLERVSADDVCKLIKADTLCNFNVCDKSGKMFAVMVDDTGYAKELPVNVKATALYWSVCFVGTVHKILGDVVIAPDSDFAPRD